MSEQDAPKSSFGQRHPVVTIVAIIFVAGFVAERCRVPAYMVS